MNKSVYIPTYLTLMNGIFNLTKTEIRILSEFIAFDPDRIASALARKVVAEKLGLLGGEDGKSLASLNNYVKKLKEKKVILTTEDSYYTLHPNLHPKHFAEGIQFKFTYVQA